MVCAEMVPKAVNPMFPQKYLVVPNDTLCTIFSLTNSLQ